LQEFGGEKKIESRGRDRLQKGRQEEEKARRDREVERA